MGGGKRRAYGGHYERRSWHPQGPPVGGRGGNAIDIGNNTDRAPGVFKYKVYYSQNIQRASYKLIFLKLSLIYLSSGRLLTGEKHLQHACCCLCKTYISVDGDELSPEQSPPAIHGVDLPEAVHRAAVAGAVADGGGGRRGCRQVLDAGRGGLCLQLDAGLHQFHG